MAAQRQCGGFQNGGKPVQILVPDNIGDMCSSPAPPLSRLSAYNKTRRISWPHSASYPVTTAGCVARLTDTVDCVMHDAVIGPCPSCPTVLHVPLEGRPLRKPKRSRVKGPESSLPRSGRSRMYRRKKYCSGVSSQVGCLARQSPAGRTPFLDTDI